MTKGGEKPTIRELRLEIASLEGKAAALKTTPEQRSELLAKSALLKKQIETMKAGG